MPAGNSVSDWHGTVKAETLASLSHPPESPAHCRVSARAVIASLCCSVMPSHWNTFTITSDVSGWEQKEAVPEAAQWMGSICTQV